MLEVYHFVNPLSTECLRTEELIQQKADEANRQVMLRIIPVMTLQAVSAVFAESGRRAVPLADRNIATSWMYELARDFKAAQFQGNRVARRYLIAIQTEILVHHQSYSSRLALRFAEKLGLDVSEFIADRRSEAVKKALQADQTISQELHIANQPTLVVYDNLQSDDAIKTTDFSTDTLDAIFERQESTPIRAYDGWLHNGGYTEMEEG
jgi:hypothetical protein